MDINDISAFLDTLLKMDINDISAFLDTLGKGLI